MKKHIIWILAVVMLLGSLRSFAQTEASSSSLCADCQNSAQVDEKIATTTLLNIQILLQEAEAKKAAIVQLQDDIGRSYSDTGGALKMLGEAETFMDEEITKIKSLQEQAKTGSDAEALNYYKQALTSMQVIHRIDLSAHQALK